ncbi:MAG: Zn-ribbon domain-containing OB-fold protein, partial [Acidimicrobiia bacterium]|nr:Zn-ribbon domain-containing OB-fold protein [Acidimicrobiia bacterium]
MAEIQHPLPNASWETRGYWEGAGRGEIVLQRCRACGTVQHKPRGVCATCLSGDIEHFVASGKGTVYTFTVTHQNQVPPFAAACPYVMAYVQTAEGPRILTHIVGCEPDDVRVGMDVVA